MFDEIIKKLIEKKLTIVTAESLTGGLIAKAITDVPGASSILKESFVVYSNEAKIDILGVKPETIDKYGVVSSEVAYEMVDGLYKKTKRNICISTTGNAGPTICDDKPVGRVYIGICFNGNVETYTCEFGNVGRDMVRNNTMAKVFELICEYIK